MKTLILILMMVSTVVRSDDDQHATSYRDAKYASCQSDQYNFWLSFPNQKFKMDRWGVITGNIGEVDFAFKKSGDEDYQEVHLPWPALISNGPSTTIAVYDYGLNFKGEVKTYDFRTGTAKLIFDGNEKNELQCVYYKSKPTH